MASDLSLLIPFRTDGGVRQRAWEYCEAYYREQLPEAEISIGRSGDGPFNRSEAVNHAAALATSDVFVIMDADLLVDRQTILDCAAAVRSSSRWFVPYKNLRRLTASASEEVLRGLDPAEAEFAKIETEPWGAINILSRQAWDSVGGMDERFLGWGREDVAFRLSLDTLFAKHERTENDVYHLWHPKGTPGDSHLLLREYMRSSSHRGKMVQTLRRRDRARPSVSNEARLSRSATVPSLSLLVPFQASEDDPRTTAWSWVRSYWERELPEAEIIVGTDPGPGPYSKTTAVNDAFGRATGDVLFVCDADSVMPGDAIREAARLAHAGFMVVPWSHNIRLTPEATLALMSGTPLEKVARMPSSELQPKPVTAGVMFLLASSSFKTVQGMDPRFRGWGYEDISFRRCCDVLVGPTTYLRGVALSLHHARPRAHGDRIWGDDDEGRMNEGLGLLYRRATTVLRMQALVNQHPLGEDPLPIPQEMGRLAAAQQARSVRRRGELIARVPVPAPEGKVPIRVDLGHHPRLQSNVSQWKQNPNPERRPGRGV